MGRGTVPHHGVKEFEMCVLLMPCWLCLQNQLPTSQSSHLSVETEPLPNELLHSNSDKHIGAAQSGQGWRGVGGGNRQLLAQSEPNHGPAQLCRGRSSEGQRKDSGGRRPGGSGGAVDAEFCVFLFHRPLRGLRTALRIRSGPVPISQTGH